MKFLLNPPLINLLVFLTAFSSYVLNAQYSTQTSPEQARKTFKQLYADRLAAVTRSVQFTDDLELAKELILAATQSQKSPQFAHVLASNAAILASKNPAGYQTAAQAWHIVANADPANALKYKAAAADLIRKSYIHARDPERTRIASNVIAAYSELAKLYLDNKQYAQAVSAYQVAYRQALAVKSGIAPFIKRNLDTAVAAKRVQRQLEAEKNKLKRNPNDANAAKQLIHLYLVELDDPQSALPYTIIATDTSTRNNINLTKSLLTSLTETQIIQLADWRLQLASTATTNRSRAAMLIHADKYYTHFLGKGSTNAFLNSKVRLARTRIQKQLAALQIRLKPPIDTSKVIKISLAGKIYPFQNNAAAVDRSVYPPILLFKKNNAHLIIHNHRSPPVVNKTFTVTASIKPESSNGVIFARGGVHDGYSLYLRSQSPAAAVRIDRKLYSLQTKKILPKDKFSKLTLKVTKDPSFEIYLDDKLLAQRQLPSLFRVEPTQAFQIASDTINAVGSYTSPNHFTGEIKSLTLTYHK